MIVCVVTTFSLSSASSAPSFSCLLFLLMWRGALTGTTGPHRTRPHQQGQRRRTKGGGGEKVAPLLSSAIGRTKKEEEEEDEEKLLFFPFSLFLFVLLSWSRPTSRSRSRLVLISSCCCARYPLETARRRQPTTNG